MSAAMQMVFTLSFGAALAWFTWIRLHSLMVYYQQEEYDSGRLKSAVFRMRLFDVRASIVLLATLILAFSVSKWWLAVAPVALVAIAALERRYKFKKPLAKTDRVRRMLRGAAAFMALPMILAALWPAWSLIMIQAIPLSLMAANRMLLPMQARINDGFIAQAEEKLARMNPQVIGITGSFGKTTVKHMLAEILEAAAPVFYSRGSINTKLGLTRHIRQRLQWGHKYFIAEMGAYGIGSVQRLCDFVHPTWGIVTSVGDAHMERFGSLDVIARAKSELAADICARGGRVVVNGDLLSHEVFEKLRAEYPEQVVTVGREDTSDIVITSAEMIDEMWHISLRGAAIPDVDFVLPLLGDHNVMNAALAMGLAAMIAPEKIQDMVAAAAEVSQIPHRLQKRERPGEPLVIDDAYNSNEIGFESAVAVGRTLADGRGGKLILITPGLAELGARHDDVHRSLGRIAGEACDQVIVVNPDRIPSFVEAAQAAPRAETTTCPTLTHAQTWMRANTGEQDVVIFENDLPDLLEAKRLF